MTRTLEQLLKQISPDTPNEELNRTFPELAKTLICNYKIVKGKNKFYDITSLEFYYCSKNHFDLTVYPRKEDYGKWFFHNSGMDLTFKSEIMPSAQKIDYGKDFGYGGILIRGIKANREGTTGDNNKVIIGPLKVEWELFDKFNALNADENMDLVPVIIKRDSPLNKNIVRVKRKNITLTRFENQLPNMSDILNKWFSYRENEKELIKQAKALIDDENIKETWLGYEVDEKVK